MSTRAVRNVRVDGADVSLEVELGYPGKSQMEPIRQMVLAALRQIPGLGNASVAVTMKIVAHTVQRGVSFAAGRQERDRGGLGQGRSG